MKFKLVLILAVIVLGKFTYDQLVPPFTKGEPAPQFALSDINGDTVRLNDFNGRPVLIHFWATWCTQCVQEIPLLESFAGSFPKVKILAINEDEGGMDVVSAFFAKARPSFTVLLDSEGRVADKYKSYKVPESYLIDKEGKVLYRFSGRVSWNSPNVSEFVKKILSESS